MGAIAKDTLHQIGEDLPGSKFDEAITTCRIETLYFLLKQNRLEKMRF